MNSLSVVSVRWLYLLIFLSGSSGLIYQVVWHKYLAILLGAHARATAIVLAIFLGGISAGYQCFGKWSRTKGWNLFVAYAFVELGMGFWAYSFPHFFRFAFSFSAQLYAFLGINSLWVDIGLSILLLGPATFLMGGTLPLLTQALSRGLDDASIIHAKIYGWNTVGACFGCLLAGYVLIPTTDLPITLLIAGTGNVLVSVISYFGYAKSNFNASNSKRFDFLKTPPSKFTVSQLCILAIGFLSGFYLITLETVLIRLMGLSTGSSHYNFTLIVAIFVLGLGLGSLFVKRISTYSYRQLFWNQLLASFFLLMLYFSGDHWSYAVHVIRASLRDIPQNFFVYQTFLGIAFFTMMILPIGLCGLTLPLCFHLLKDKEFNLGERVGQLYGLNTVGCVLGAILGGHTFLYFLNLDQLFKVCIFLCLIGCALSGWIYWADWRSRSLEVVFGVSIFVVGILGTLLAPLYHKERFIQPFRNTQPIAATYQGSKAFETYLARNSGYLHYKDGPNTSVGIGVTRYDGKEVSRTIFVNGKSDGNTRGDAFTTLLLGHIPGLLARRLDRSCVIGFGTGMTIGALASYDNAKQIDVAEISDTIIKSAHYFDSYNGGVSTNSKVHINEMDAFRFLGGTSSHYDVIISEPSNPWVTGIENLYSSEFYAIAKKKLMRDGIFVQWIHTYSFNDGLFRMILKTMGQHFPYISTFQLKGGDLALVGLIEPLQKEDLDRAQIRMESQPQVKQSLAEAGIDRFETVLALELITPEVSWAAASGAFEQSIENPRLSNGAAKAFFEGSSAKVQSMRRNYVEFFSSSEKSLLATYRSEKWLPWDVIMSFKNTFCDQSASKNTLLCSEALALARITNTKYEPGSAYEEYLPSREVASLGGFTPQASISFSTDELQRSYQMFESFKKYYSPLARIPIDPLLARLDYCIRSGKRDTPLFGECILQRILVSESIQRHEGEYLHLIGVYNDWFKGLSEKFPNFSRFREAKNILEKLSPKEN